MRLWDLGGPVCHPFGHITDGRCCRKTSQLEERLNRLVNTLRVSGNVSALPTGPSTGQPGPSRQSYPISGPAFSLLSGQPTPDFYTQSRVSPWDVEDLADARPINIPETYNSFVPPTCICKPEPGEAPPPPDTDENLLKIYRTKLAPCFPFVLVPDDVSATILGATRPFLMAAIRMVSSYRSMKSMRGQMYRLLNHVADHMLLRSERSFDLLLGLVVMLGWFHQHCIAHAQLNQLVSLATCLVGELGLKRSPCLPERTRLLVMRPRELRERTNEERRLLLAVWYLSSCISMDIHQIDSMRYSGYMQQCLRELEEDAEFESDIHLGYIVRIQRLCERISDLRSKDYLDEEGDESTRAPLSAYVSGFRAELNKLQASMPPSLKNNAYLQVRMATLRLRIHEPPRIDAELLASLSKSLDSISAGSTSALDAFYQSNAALKAWFDTWLSVPKDFFYCIPISIASHMVYAIMMMSRWSWLTTTGHPPPEPRTEPEPVDPSDGNPNAALAAMEAAISPNTPASTSSPSTGGTKASSPWQTTLPDKDLPQVLAALKAQLSTQPDLMLDVEGYLNRTIAQLHSIDAAYSEMSVDEGEWRGNIWSLGATKVKIAMLRQQRWSKIIAAQAEERELEVQSGRGGGGGGGGEQFGMGEIEMQENFLASLQMPEWDASMVWNPPTYFDTLSEDQALWTDIIPGEQDWGLGGMGGMGSLGQMPESRYM
ncbi:hypothetical protein CORC01_13737 [Colletotrichum orchidophilum]|uniref:Transcription factor domain-containing protein n=1 Tax=Colletotrichum orchidophilum TaxID=1209926 RepID=A0A1G4AP44_9PEZI|nr:uncharacterized protein CORC01_13737 [Colletotrichum orchidophilum]OHE90960.1 hypothetical protein CORC01_13737 [Colletotrichum orchidophilum]